MKNVLKLEELGLFLLVTVVYFQYYGTGWGLFLALFLAPDLAFVFYLISAKAGAVAYNITHHKGIMALIILSGVFLQNDLIIQIGLIFMAHSSFDRIFGYGLKFPDAFSHTHLGWIGKGEPLESPH